MLAKKSTKALLAALQSSLWGKDIETQFFEHLQRSDWIELFQMSFQQTVEGMVCAGLQKLPPDLLPSSDLMLKWLVRLERIEAKNKQIAGLIVRQYQQFRTNGIRCLMQKGHGVSHFYLAPMQRTSGDIDWFFPTKMDYENALMLVKSSGLDIKNKNTYSLGYDEVNIEIEHHRRIIQLRNPLIQHFSTSFVAEQIANPSFLLIEDTPIEVPSPLLNLVQVNAHILKHQISYGIGLRQLCDSARLYDFIYQNSLTTSLKEIYKALGMYKWSHYLHSTLNRLLDLPLEVIPYELPQRTDSTWMQEHILRTGNFGFYDPAHPDIKKLGGRIDRPVRLMKSFNQFLFIAPMEALSFPFYQLYIKNF